ncbi:hypothetical protein EJ08DRAFT_89542 [Tothia fuscella]|uniref:Uncharacterized protein n=1 Tax=Tothia fuscella TaxID=1048955 RepID=A0A9P4U145_9PEZI|nr:hypothetical protein EJ08DRAFT_89542 [Tothia fuscella]
METMTTCTTALLHEAHHELHPEPLLQMYLQGLRLRALSLTNMKSRSNLKDQKRRAPPVPSPEQPWSATFSATESPKHIKKPFELTPPHTPNRVFEEPRPAPQPPVRNSSNTTMQVAGPPTPKHSSEEPRSILKQTLPIERAFEGPRSRPVMMKSNSTLPIVTPIASIVTFDTSGKPRPPLRRKTSKFVEHIDTNPPNKEANGITQPLPLMPSVSFQLPILPVEKQSPQNVAIKRSATVASQPAKPLDHYERTYAGRSPRGTRFQSNVQEPEVGHSLTSVRLRQTLDHNSARKVSVSTTKPAITRVPIPAPVLKRASSMRTRPPTVWGDICMAEVKPVLMSPIVAVGPTVSVSRNGAILEFDMLFQKITIGVWLRPGPG